MKQIYLFLLIIAYVNVSFGQCTTGCNVNIFGNKATATAVPAGQKLCIRPTIGGNITISGQINLGAGSTVEICTTSPTDTVIFTNQFVAPSGGSSTATINIYGNFTHKPTTNFANYSDKFTVNNSGYFKIMGQLNNSSQLTNLAGGIITSVGTTATVTGALMFNAGSFTNNGTVLSGGAITVGITAFTNNATIISKGDFTVTSSGGVINSSTGYIHAKTSFEVNGALTNYNNIEVDGLLGIYSGTMVDISNGHFKSYDLNITKGDLTAMGGCASFYVTNYSTVTSSPEFFGTIYIQDISNAADSIDFNNGCGTCNFKSGTGGGTCPSRFDNLPVELISFDAVKISDHVKLVWVTSAEVNNSHFEIERSSDAVNFVALATVTGAGNSTAINNYSYNDAQFSSGANYYRLKQVDYDGTYAYSNIVAVNVADLQVISTYPNPATDHLTILIFSDQEEMLYIDLVNVMGQGAGHYEVRLHGGSNTYEMNIAELSEGTYLLRGQTDSGKAISYSINIKD